MVLTAPPIHSHPSAPTPLPDFREPFVRDTLIADSIVIRIKDEAFVTSDVATVTYTDAVATDAVAGDPIAPIHLDVHLEPDPVVTPKPSTTVHTEYPYIIYIDSLPAPAAGLITAGEWFDHKDWSGFQEYLRRYPEYFNAWRMDLQRRICVRVKDRDGLPVPDAQVALFDGDSSETASRTYADGSAAFFPRLGEAGNRAVKVTWRGSTWRTGIKTLPDDDQLWDVVLPFSLPAEIKAPPRIDIAFVVDVTGSMGDELAFLQKDLNDIVSRALAGTGQDLRVGFVFYRDRGDDFITTVHPFTSNIALAVERLGQMEATGGGDVPEDVNQALADALHDLDWTGDRAVRLLFLIGDAPPHYYADQNYTYRDAAEEAAARGIKIMPVAASDIDRSAEYLFRNLAVRTEGKYMFITDHSGIGNAHLTPEVGDHVVGPLNAMLARTIKEEFEAWPSHPGLQ
jgi:hypothetical protein